MSVNVHFATGPSAVHPDSSALALGGGTLLVGVAHIQTSIGDRDGFVTLHVYSEGTWESAHVDPE